MRVMTRHDLLVWSLIALGTAIVVTLLIRLLFRVVERTLPTWDLAEAKKRLSRSFPDKDIYQIVSYMIKRDRSYAWMLDFLPWQCLGALFLFATLWAYVLPKDSRFWLPLVQNLFVFEITLLALQPAFRMLQKMQHLTIARVQELLKQKNK